MAEWSMRAVISPPPSSSRKSARMFPLLLVLRQPSASLRAFKSPARTEQRLL